MSTKRVSYPVEVKALGGDQGQVEAIVSIFGNVDLMGDRVMPGAFRKSIAEWKQSGDPVPVVFSHEWGDLFSHIGVVDELQETPKGLRAVYTLDINDNPAAAQAFKLLKRRTLKEHSFAYDVVNEHRAKDGANELTELKIIEIGPTLKGANPDTELIGVKSLIGDTIVAKATGTEVEITEPDRPSVEDRANARALSISVEQYIDEEHAKAGARLSQATQAEMQAIRDDATALVTRIDALLGIAEDVAKSSEADGAKTAAADLNEMETEKPEDDTEPPSAKSIDPDLLRIRTRIEEMRATTRDS